MASVEGDRIEDVARAITAQGRVIAMLVQGQKLHIEMLAKVLEAVTKEGDSTLADLLARLANESGEHTTKLDLILERVYLG
jgi:hypothetical protein